MIVPRSLARMARARATVRRLNEIGRAVRAELEHHGVGGVVVDVSSGYDNRALAWQDYDEVRPPIGFRAT